MEEEKSLDRPSLQELKDKIELEVRRDVSSTVDSHRNSLDSNFHRILKFGSIFIGLLGILFYFYTDYIIENSVNKKVDEKIETEFGSSGIRDRIDDMANARLNTFMTETEEKLNLARKESLQKSTVKLDAVITTRIKELGKEQLNEFYKRALKGDPGPPGPKWVPKVSFPPGFLKHGIHYKIKQLGDHLFCSLTGVKSIYPQTEEHITGHCECTVLKKHDENDAWYLTMYSKSDFYGDCYCNVACLD